MHREHPATGLGEDVPVGFAAAMRPRLRGPVCTPHDLGRTFATRYLQKNPGQHLELAELMGHSDLRQVTKYALVEAERTRAGVGKL